MLVYRIENSKGNGVYTGSLGFLAAANMVLEKFTVPAGEGGDHPTPDLDPGLSRWWEGPEKNWTRRKAKWHEERRQYVCGFADEAQMLAWFPPEGMKIIQDHGARVGEDSAMRVLVYEVHGRRVRRGARQVMFRKEDARLIETREAAHYM